MQIPENEIGLSLVDAVYAATGRKPHLSTVIRWCQRRNRYGVRLQSWMLGGRRVTSVEAVNRFNEATTAAANRSLPPSTPAQRGNAHASAKAELEREFA